MTTQTRTTTRADSAMNTTVAWAVALLLPLGACTGEGAAGGSVEAGSNAQQGDSSARGPASAGMGGSTPERSATAGTPRMAGPDTVGNPAGPGTLPSVSGGPDQPARAGGRVSTGSTPIPCGVDAVLATSCRGCHGNEPGGLAPMALMTHEDLVSPAVSDPNEPVYRLVRDRVHKTRAGQMPPAGGGRPLTDAELSSLDAWIDDGAPQGAEACSDSATPEAVSAITYGPTDPDEIEACYKLYAHQNSIAGDEQPFLARTGEFYTSFYFDVPWEGDKQAILFRSSDSAITHHWLLYDTPEELPDGTVVAESTGSHFGAPDLLAAWAINQQREQAMPKEVGLAMPSRGSGRKFLLEVHYFNDGEPVPDNSGVEICVGKKPRPNTATVSWLGSEAIALLPGSPLDLVGTCTPQYQGDIYIFRSFPHMHEQGYHLKTEIRRTDGSVETLVDTPFDFNNQLMYDTPAVIHPGEQLLTTCRYQNRTERLIGVGYDSLSEMCFNFVYAWPAKTLIGGVSLTGTSTPCLL